MRRSMQMSTTEAEERSDEVVVVEQAEAGGCEEERGYPSPLPLPGSVEEAPEDQLLDDRRERTRRLCTVFISPTGESDRSHAGVGSTLGSLDASSPGSPAAKAPRTIAPAIGERDGDALAERDERDLASTRREGSGAEARPMAVPAERGNREQCQRSASPKVTKWSRDSQGSRGQDRRSAADSDREQHDELERKDQDRDLETGGSGHGHLLGRGAAAAQPLVQVDLDALT